MELKLISQQEYDDIQQQLAEIKEMVKSDRRPEILDNADLIQMLKVSTRTLATWREDGTIKYSKIGSKIYYRQEDVEELLKKHQQPKTF